MGLGELLDQRSDDDAVGLGEAGERFVEQQQLGVGGERDGDFEQALGAMRKVDGAFGGLIDEADGVEDRPGALVDGVDVVRVA